MHAATAPAILEKQERLLDGLRRLETVIVALSGGTDSAYLAWAAHLALGDRALSVTALSPSFSAFDREQVESFVKQAGVRHEFLETHEVENPRYAANNADRCYHCKDELFTVLDRVARARRIAAVAYGENTDDKHDFRPGHRAAAEHRIIAPLTEAGLSKAEIRELSRRAGLATWNRPASACLSSRIPFGAEVTPEKLAQIERGEAILREMGFRQIRVRHHGELARIEIAQDELERALRLETVQTLARRFREAGFLYVTLDLDGYRQGSLNAALKLL